MRASTKYFTALATLLPVVLAGEIDPTTCTEYAKNIGNYHYQNFGGCNAMINNCVDTFIASGDHNPWGTASCVASATCWGTKALTEYLQCKDSSFEPSDAPALDKDGVWTPDLVQNCENDCALAFSAYSNFIHNTVEAVGSSAFPQSDDYLKQNYWSYIVDWANTGDAVPYAKFNDWLFK